MDTIYETNDKKKFALTNKLILPLNEIFIFVMSHFSFQLRESFPVFYLCFFQHSPIPPSNCSDTFSKLFSLISKSSVH